MPPTRIRTKRAPGSGGGGGGGTAVVRIGPDYGAAPPSQQQALLLGPQKLILPLGTLQTLAASNLQQFTDLIEFQTLAQSSVATAAKTGAAELQTLGLSRNRVTITAPAQSGTPDVDSAGDTWVDQANPGTHHGSDTFLAMNPAVLGNNETRGIFECDFTRFSATNQSAAVGGIHTTNFLALRVNNTALIANVLSIQLSATASRPFTESTQGWTEPAAGTVLTTATPSCPVGVSTQLVALTDAQLNSLLGKWLYVRFTTSAVGSGFQISSRESANKPLITFDLKSP